MSNLGRSCKNPHKAHLIQIWYDEDPLICEHMRETLEVKKECDMDKPHSYRRYEYSRREDGRTATENIAVVDT